MTVKTVNEYIDEIKGGKTVTVSCSLYEEYMWFENGKFYSAMENGVHDSITKERSEEWIRDNIGLALRFPAEKDLFVEG